MELLRLLIEMCVKIHAWILKKFHLQIVSENYKKEEIKEVSNDFFEKDPNCKQETAEAEFKWAKANAYLPDYEKYYQDIHGNIRLFFQWNEFILWIKRPKK